MKDLSLNSKSQVALKESISKNEQAFWNSMSRLDILKQIKEMKNDILQEDQLVDKKWKLKK